jgi:Rap1a immunity proteins
MTTGLPGFLHRIAVALTAWATTLASAQLSPAAQSPNKAGMLLRQCEAMLSRTAEAPALMTCENTIWSTLRAIEQIKLENPSLKLRYCAPGEVSVARGAALYAAYVNAHPEALNMPAEHALILALEAAYPCPR